MKYAYTSTLAVDTQGRYAKRPMVEIELVGKKWVNGLALIDSGADCNMINMLSRLEFSLNMEGIKST